MPSISVRASFWPIFKHIPISIAFSSFFPHFSPVTITRHFHGWETPSLPSAAGILTQNWAQNGYQGPLDLRDELILVSTRHAGRRLRAELARIASEKGTAVLSGAIVTPEHLLPLPAEAASDALVLALLAQRLLAQHKELPALFPSPQTDWTFSFALGIADQLQDVRRQLAEADLSTADLVPLVPDDEN